MISLRWDCSSGDRPWVLRCT